VKAGRKPTPTKLKLLRGNPGKRKLGKGEPEPKVEAPACPPHLDEEARAEWGRIEKELLLLGLLTNLDRAALAAYCQAWSRWVDAETKLQQFGTVIKAPSGYPIQSPYVTIANQAAKQMREFLVEFGLTPSSRTRVHAILPRPENELDKFLRGG
jgi:P27 family predicted phage terminase small subunit